MPTGIDTPQDCTGHASALRAAGYDATYGAVTP
jgi:hypothetical protein